MHGLLAEGHLREPETKFPDALEECPVRFSGGLHLTPLPLQESFGQAELQGQPATVGLGEPLRDPRHATADAAHEVEPVASTGGTDTCNYARETG